jgi:hypothetical protein
MTVRGPVMRSVARAGGYPASARHAASKSVHGWMGRSRPGAGCANRRSRPGAGHPHAQTDDRVRKRDDRVRKRAHRMYGWDNGMRERGNGMRRWAPPSARRQGKNRC